VESVPSRSNALEAQNNFESPNHGHASVDVSTLADYKSISSRQGWGIRVVQRGELEFDAYDQSWVSIQLNSTAFSIH